MLERILEKLHCTTIEEFFEREKKILEKFSGMEIERRSPLLDLTDEEMAYFETEILPSLKQ